MDNLLVFQSFINVNSENHAIVPLRKEPFSHYDDYILKLVVAIDSLGFQF